MFDNSFSKAQEEYDRKEPPDNRSKNVIEYQDRSTASEQAQICANYLDYSNGWLRYDEAKRATQIGLIAYVEKLDSFWEYLG